MPGRATSPRPPSRKYLSEGKLSDALLADGTLDAAKADKLLASSVTRGRGQPVDLTAGRARRLRAQIRGLEDQVKELRGSLVRVDRVGPRVAGAPLLVLLIGAIAAWAAHSSVAVVLLVMSLATHGVVDLEPALMLVLGANLGTAINPLLEATGRGSATARRLPLANLLNRLVGIAVSFPVLARPRPTLPAHGLTGGAAVAVFHLGFNLLMALVTFRRWAGSHAVWSG